MIVTFIAIIFSFLSLIISISALSMSVAYKKRVDQNLLRFRRNGNNQTSNNIVPQSQYSESPIISRLASIFDLMRGNKDASKESDIRNIVGIVTEIEKRLLKINEISEEKLVGMALERTKTVCRDFRCILESRLEGVIHNLSEFVSANLEKLEAEIEDLKNKSNRTKIDGNRLLELRQKKLRYISIRDSIALTTNELMELNRKLTTIQDELLSTSASDQVSIFELSSQIDNLKNIIERIQEI